MSESLCADVSEDVKQSDNMQVAPPDAVLKQQENMQVAAPNTANNQVWPGFFAAVWTEILY